MSKINIAIPLYGKMAARALHQPMFRQELVNQGFKPLFFLNPTHLRLFDFDPSQYFGLNVEAYEKFDAEHFLLQQIRMLRRFVVRTETTDLRFREMIQSKLFDATLMGMSAQMTFVGVLRNIPNVGRLLEWLEGYFYTPKVHGSQFDALNIQCVLTPGMGNFGFWQEGSFALEAQQRNIPSFAVITNYDNIVNMGYRGFTPICLGVWSKQMADEAMRLHGFSAKQLEITGPIQYDRYLHPLSVSRDEFLNSLGLDPAKKTILFAGGVNINHYFDMYRVFVEQKTKVWRESFNLVVRPYPHVKLLGSPAWRVLERLFKDAGAYLSNPGSIDGSGDRNAELKLDLAFDDTIDELACLLRYSDVMVNYFSTISLEAAICDLPVIHVGYDAFAHGQNFGVTSAFLQRQTHNSRQLRLSAARVVRNEADLFASLEAYLSDRALDQEARRKYAESECDILDGKSSERLVNMIRARL
ncbi:MAG: CDP-glycerol glycerophosphotransferase family protein [Anaerolineales bacterium]|jgi:hypothetical protein|nr:CDP-glycerol glycerophosphotransferase family protein [Anaerolineales bacterium]